MMKISGVSGVNMQAGQFGSAQEIDTVSKSLKNQIENAQNQLQELSSNDEMSMEEKMERRKELQKQISDLNSQLRQHQMEQRRAAREQQAKESMMESENAETEAEQTAADGQTTGLSRASMHAIISADSSMTQADLQGRVVTKMEGRARVLESEIKLDSARGQSTETKEKELADMERRASAASVSRMKMLGEANQTMKKAAKEDQKSDKADKAKAEDKKADRDKPVETEKKRMGDSSNIVWSESNAFAGKAAKDTKQVIGYASLDIRM